MKQIKNLILIVFFVIISIFVFYGSLRYFRESYSPEDIAPKTGRFVQSNDVKIYIQELGDPKNPAVVLIHGMGSWSELWKETMVELSNNGYYAIAFDLPPFGFSERPGPKNLSSKEQAKRLVTILDAIGVQKFHFVGHSFGGGATLHTALTIPNRILSLQLVDIAVNLEEKKETTVTEPSFLEKFWNFSLFRNRILEVTATNPHLTKILFSQFVHSADCITEEKVKIIQKPMQLKGTTAFLGDWLGEFIFHSNDELAKDFKLNANLLTMPIGILWGDLDTVTPISDAYKIQTYLKNSQLHLISGVGHIPQLESPNEFHKVLINNLKSVDGNR
ncbi:alpha/beta hydrolase family protein [Leptospira yanagawae serovar Saopaulo str. Sao Paulo = ATCC 700523]|uniref:Alpha/beta hydrolase family protein n=1 Tax=Leptospira yanagawae serovar Saopaulo str. Sao Paulo = ATCC 700523 TaxID=1249483 RepID=A0A5E8HH63_9LEPT|nr:alpha/beta hydrolase [Leptospira yanagawae]EOQ89326.1 alpha/beta hydrolase family protein [Leptospira yanagawae serovar Saopaulo str. Sao Paulo = ATCC 700523]